MWVLLSGRCWHIADKMVRNIETQDTSEMHYSSLVFDLDGTISDPSLGIVRCFNHALCNYGLPKVSDKRIRQEIGPPLDETFIKLTPSSSGVSVDSLISTYRERYADIGYAENTLYEGIPEALTRLKKGGTSMGVCTSKRKDFAEKILSMFGLDGLFDFVSGGDVGISKTSQLSTLLGSSFIDRQAVMIGDREIDISSARRNRLRAIGVLWGFGGLPELSKATPTHILNIPEELCDIESYKN